MTKSAIKPAPLEVVQAFYEKIWNAGDLEATRSLLASDFVFRGSLGPELRGRGAFCDYVRSVRSALKEYRCEILDSVSEGRKAFAKMRFSGVHVGQFRGYSPTGKPVHWLGAALFQIEESVIVELWVLGDLTSLESLLKSNAANLR